MLLFKVISTIVLLNLLILLFLANKHSEFDTECKHIYKETISLSVILLYLAYAHMDFDKEVEHIYRETIGLSIILFTISILFVWL